MGGGPTAKDAVEGKGPQRRPQKELDRRSEEVANAVGGGYCWAGDDPLAALDQERAQHLHVQDSGAADGDLESHAVHAQGHDRGVGGHHLDQLIAPLEDRRNGLRERGRRARRLESVF